MSRDAAGFLATSGPAARCALLDGRLASHEVRDELAE
jgi:hypothetical protein